MTRLSLFVVLVRVVLYFNSLIRAAENKHDADDDEEEDVDEYSGITRPVICVGVVPLCSFSVVVVGSVVNNDFFALFVGRVDESVAVVSPEGDLRFRFCWGLDMEDASSSIVDGVDLSVVGFFDFLADFGGGAPDAIANDDDDNDS